MIFIAGATGFVGRHLVDSFQDTGTQIRCLVRDKGKSEWIEALGFETVEGDLADPDSLKGQMDGAETLVHLVGIIKEEGSATFHSVHVEGTQNLVNEAIGAGIKKVFYQSALGADLHSPYKYCNTKAHAEEIVKSSSIPYTIFRPSLIVGPGDGFTERMKMLISAGPVVPIPGKGLAKFQPFYIKDWLRCFHAVLQDEGTKESTYEIGGPEQLTYQEILQEIMSVLKVDKSIVHMPMGMTRLTLPFMGVIRPIASALGRQIPEVTGELLSLLDVDNICEVDSIQRDFGFEPIRFSDALKEFIKVQA